MTFNATAELGFGGSEVKTHHGLEEVSSTLASATAKTERYERTGGPGAVDLLDASFQEVEAAMTEGHPGFVANNGRIGFGLAEYRAYAPENGGRVRLVWLAARREHTHLALGAIPTRVNEKIQHGRRDGLRRE
jgi:siderophore synthetase component